MTPESCRGAILLGIARSLLLRTPLYWQASERIRITTSRLCLFYPNRKCVHVDPLFAPTTRANPTSSSGLLAKRVRQRGPFFEVLRTCAPGGASARVAA